ncbi:MAG: ParA family protein [Synergistaceae bacterium]|nr:ParA family protein [Synergistaceae bacterium]
MKVVSRINYKGGVGKTTLTANLGAYAALRGLRVLLVDLDPQTHLTFSFMTHDQWHKKYEYTKTLKIILTA